MSDLKELFTSLKPDPKNDLLTNIENLNNLSTDIQDRLTNKEFIKLVVIIDDLIKIYKSK